MVQILARHRKHFGKVEKQFTKSWIKISKKIPNFLFNFEFHSKFKKLYKSVETYEMNAQNFPTLMADDKEMFKIIWLNMSRAIK